MRQPVLALIAFSEADQKEELSDDCLEIKFGDLLLHLQAGASRRLDSSGRADSFSYAGILGSSSLAANLSEAASEVCEDDARQYGACATAAGS
jgi:hypothetical protein